MNLKSTTSSISDFFYARPKLKYYLPQALTIFFIVFIFGYFSYNAQVNMDNRGIDFGLRFLGEGHHLIFNLLLLWNMMEPNRMPRLI